MAWRLRIQSACRLIHNSGAYSALSSVSILNFDKCRRTRGIISGQPGRETRSMEKDIPAQDLFSTQTEKGKLQDEKAIVTAVIKYFEAAPCGLKSTKEDAESSIIKAFHRYFVKK